MTQKPPAPVEVTNTEPMPVVVERPSASSAQVNADILRTEDQRRISGIWERTQQVIALAVVCITLGVSAFKAIFDALSDPQRGIAAGPAFLFLVGASNLVIGFYFGRTNHQRVGGVASDRDDMIGR